MHNISGEILIIYRYCISVFQSSTVYISFKAEYIVLCFFHRICMITATILFRVHVHVVVYKLCNGRVGKSGKDVSQP